MEKISDEYQPFGVGLDSLDAQTVSSLLRQNGASSAAIQSIGSDDSALQGVWRQAILRLRRVPSNPHELFRLKGGNQMLPDAFAVRLGDCIRKNCAVTHIRHAESGVVVMCREKGEEKKFEADYLVCCMSAVMLRAIPATPAWPEDKHYAIANMPYTVETRPIFQSRTKFWKRDGYSGNMEFGSPLLGPLWPMAQDVPTDRGLLIGTAQGGVSARAAYDVFKRYYPGKSADIDHVMAVDWQQDTWAMACQARDYRPGQLKKFWPASIQPVGRVYFAGAYCDNMNWGMEAATRSAHRVARAIDSA
jgi:monoamine oxidase